MEPLSSKDPKTIGDYTLIGRLGSGGMGVVYIASKGSETVALKIIRDSIIDDPSQATRFIREIETLKSINSSHVAKVLDTGTHNERPWFTTEFVNGPDLKSYVSDKGPLTGQAWDSLAKGLLDGISAIHAAEVIHRDIKPANIILSETGPKIIDFGIAQVADATSVTSTGAIVGTPAWFSPEQIEGSEISMATDLFSAGSTLVYAATGKTPWGDIDSTTKASVYKILLDEPDLSGLTEEQSRLVSPLLNKDPLERLGRRKENVVVQELAQIDSRRNWRESPKGLSLPTTVILGIAGLLIATGGGIAISSIAGPENLAEQTDSGEQPAAEDDPIAAKVNRPLGSDFFEEVAIELEFTSEQVDDRISFILGGPGASYVRAAEVSLSGLPEEWTDRCDSPIALERVPVGVAYWIGSCELSLPASGETLSGSVSAQLMFIDNDGMRYTESIQADIEVQALPKPPPPPIFLRLQQADSDDSYWYWENWWSTRNGYVIHRHCVGQVAYDFRINNPEQYQVLGISGDWITVSSGNPLRAAKGCDTAVYGTGYEWSNSISGAQIKQHAAGRPCVILRHIELGWNQEQPPYQYTNSIEVCFS